MRFSKLRGAIREKYGTQEAFAQAMDMHPVTLSKKLTGMVDWSRQEVKTAAELLDIPFQDVGDYFFTN